MDARSLDHRSFPGVRNRTRRPHDPRPVRRTAVRAASIAATLLLVAISPPVPAAPPACDGLWSAASDGPPVARPTRRALVLDDRGGPADLAATGPTVEHRTADGRTLLVGVGVAQRGADRIAALVIRSGPDRLALVLPLPGLDADDPRTAALLEDAPPLPDVDGGRARCLVLAHRHADRTFGECLREHLGTLDRLADLSPPCSDWCGGSAPSYLLCGLCLTALGIDDEEIERLREVSTECFRRALDEHLRLVAYCLSEDGGEREGDPNGDDPARPGDAPGTPAG